MNSKNKLLTFFISLTLILSFVFTLSGCSQNSAIGIADTEINSSGELIITYTDGSIKNLGVIRGDRGPDGAPGELVISTDSSAVAAAASKGLRSAVSIIASFEKTVQNSIGGFFPGFGGGSSTSSYSSAGSGVIYKLDKNEGDAFIITNYHVVYDAQSNSKNGISDSIRVYLYGGENENGAIDAEYVGGSLYYDIAVLRIEDSKILKNSYATAVSLSNSDSVSVGEAAIAVGNPEGAGISASYGIVSVDSEYLTMTAADGKTTVSFRVMRVDTAVNSGNSGGGLYNDRGELIGIVNAKIVDSSVENIGYAIPSNVAHSVADNIIDHCYGKDVKTVQRCMLGVTVKTENSSAVYDEKTGKLKIVETVSVYEVTKGALADGVLKSGDVFVSAKYGDTVKEITRQYHIIDLMLDVRAGTSLTLDIIRDGKPMSVTIEITEDCISAY